MKRIHFEPETDGFYGAYWKCKDESKAAIIAMLGDDPEDHMAKCGVKWLHLLGVNVLTMSPDKKDYGHHNYPLERIEAAIAWLKAHGNKKIGIVGASTTGTLALTAASYFPDITLTIGMTPSDFIWQGFMQGKRDGCKEWPIEGESLFSYQGKPLPYMPFVYQHPEYWKIVESESKRAGDMLNSRKLFDDSEKAHPLTEAEMIQVENIKGKLLLIGAADDVLWDAVKYIRRIEQRLKDHPHSCEVEVAVYEYGTHFVFPETMLQKMIPVFGDTFVKMAFAAARQHPKECKKTRVDIDRRLRCAIRAWKKQ
jgi:pimeloyl-ACP methyl ester carboxylesterase